MEDSGQIANNRGEKLIQKLTQGAVRASKAGKIKSIKMKFQQSKLPKKNGY